jgi:hypothetical protein
MLFLFSIIEANNLGVLNPSDCYESLDLSLIKDKTYIIMKLIDLPVIFNCKFH